MRLARIVVLQAVAVFVLLEIGLRIYNPFPFRIRGNHLVLPVHQHYVFHHDDARKLDPITYHTKNSLGFRGPDPPADFARRPTVVTIGGSTTECLFLSDGKTWTDVLARRLAQVRPDVWVNNAGLDGQSTFGHLVLLRDVVVSMRPTIAIFLVGLNDVGLAAINEFDRSLTPSSTPWRERWSPYDTTFVGHRTAWHDEWAFLVEHSAVFGLIENFRRAHRAKAAGFGHVEIDFAHRETFQPAAPVADEMVARVRPGMDGYARRLGEIVELCRTHGIVPVFITQPLLPGDAIDPATGVNLGIVVMRGGDNGSIVWRQQELYNDVTRRVAADRGVRLIDAARAMPKDSRLYYDLGHYTNEGAVRMGDIVADGVEPLVRAR